MPHDADYTITELADLAGVTPRTVRYYVALGLLAPPSQVGTGARYGDGHLARLRLIRKLQQEHQPLAEIRVRLEGIDDEDVERALDEDSAPAPQGSAVDYVRSVLGSGRLQRPGEPAALTLASAAPPPAWAEPLASAAPLANPTTRSQWERISLTTDIELHIRRPLSRVANKRVERLMTIARDLLEEDQP